MSSRDLPKIYIDLNLDGDLKFGTTDLDNWSPTSDFAFFCVPHQSGPINCEKKPQQISYL